MTHPDDQRPPADPPAEGEAQPARRPQGNAPSWVDDVLGKPATPTPPDGPDPDGPALGKPNLSKTPASGGDLRIPEPARPTPAPVPGPEDWISRVTGSPPPPSVQTPSAQIPSTLHGSVPQASPQPRPTAPDLDAWGEPQRPLFSPATQADERPVRPDVEGSAPTSDVAQKRLIAGLLGIFLGSLGVHKFYLGLNTQGLLILGVNVGVWILALLVGLLTLGLGLIITIPLAGLVSSALGLLGLIEGILYLTKSDTDFQRDYLVTRKPWL
ncbi:hypothetical protein GCM10010840_19820 [Deinococcus aerolatus]|uniref:TM2 domain-containing protein n=1 Tax=Deinococcus aerolatus TaxID=522487 RepID=A0ABQ2G9C2_9DEIO|nr:NINE protein [Deinococcus aerolatus]GGL82036.1 hypothetical protein GCM10010840_19820 [Deinococcus aerolatus]